MLLDRQYFKLKKGEKENFYIGCLLTAMSIIFVAGVYLMGYIFYGITPQVIFVASIISVTIGSIYTIIGMFFGNMNRKYIFQCSGCLFTGLFFSVIFSLASGYIDFLPFIILTLILSEIFFWLDKKKPQNGDNVMEYTLWRKLDQIAEAMIYVGVAMSIFKIRDEIINIFGQLIEFFIQNAQAIMQILTWVGIIALIIGGSYAFIWVNSLKYRNTKRKR